MEVGEGETPPLLPEQTKTKRKRSKGNFDFQDLKEEELCNAVFGQSAHCLFPEEVSEEEADLTSRPNETSAESIGFYIDRGQAHDFSSPQLSEVTLHPGLTQGKRPVWVDEDDEHVSVDLHAQKKLRKLKQGADEVSVAGSTYTQRLRQHFENCFGKPAWADKRKVDSSDEDELSLTSTRKFLGSSTALKPVSLLIHRLPDVNRSHQADGSINSLQFHPTSNVALIGTGAQALQIFQVDGKSNPKMQSIFIEGHPIAQATFSSDANEVIVTSCKKGFHVFDIPTARVYQVASIKGRLEKQLETFSVSPSGDSIAFAGEHGYIPIVSAKSKMWVCNYKMNGTVKALSYSQNGTRLYSFGGDGEVYVWDVRMGRCLHKFIDDGCTSGTALATSPDGNFIACGSKMGIVNVYDTSCLSELRPKPTKIVKNLTTTITGCAFNSTSEVLCMWSSVKKAQVKMLHVPTMTVFQNWPKEDTPLGHPLAVDFSHTSGYMCIGNNRGRALLYRLKHYRV